MGNNSYIRSKYFRFFSIWSNNSNRLSDIATTSSTKGPLNTSLNLQKVSGKDFGYNHTLSYFSSSRKKKGRSFNVYNFLNYNNTENEQFNNVNNVFFPTGNSTLDQLRDRLSANFTFNTTLNYTEPLSKQL